MKSDRQMIWASSAVLQQIRLLSQKRAVDFVEVVKEITTIVDGPISAEVISLEADKMVEEAKTSCSYQQEHCYKKFLCVQKV